MSTNFHQAMVIYQARSNLLSLLKTNVGIPIDPATYVYDIEEALTLKQAEHPDSTVSLIGVDADGGVVLIIEETNEIVIVSKGSDLTLASDAFETLHKQQWRLGFASGFGNFLGELLLLGVVLYCCLKNDEVEPVLLARKTKKFERGGPRIKDWGKNGAQMELS